MTVDAKLDRKIDDEAEMQQLPRAQDSLLSRESPAALTNDDALASLLEIIELSDVPQVSKDNAAWDVDGDGLLDPWSVLVLPVSSWPKELRPFVELLRP